MLSGYADEHVKAAIVEGLRRRAMDLVTAQDRGHRQTDDEKLLEAATVEGRLLLTNDTDFLRIHSDWMASGRNHSGIVFWPQPRPIGEVIRRVWHYALVTSPQDAANAIKFV
jgi:hypothetical protein